MVTAIIGNKELVQNDEQKISDFLKQRNLDMVNQQSKTVKPKDNLYTKYVKRTLDLVRSVPAFLVFLPFNFVFGVGTFLDVGTPIFFKQTRMGRHKKLFTMVKFRNMNTILLRTAN